MRPQTIDDLTPAQRQGDEFLRINLSDLPVDGAILTAVGQLVELIEIAQDKGTAAIELTQYRALVATTVLSPEQLEQKLASAQATWDYHQARYKESRKTRLLPPNGYGLLEWCKREGLTPPWFCPCGKPGVRLDLTGVPICADEDAAVELIAEPGSWVIPTQSDGSDQ